MQERYQFFFCILAFRLHDRRYETIGEREVSVAHGCLLTYRTSSSAEVRGHLISKILTRNSKDLKLSNN